MELEYGLRQLLELAGSLFLPENDERRLAQFEEESRRSLFQVHTASDLEVLFRQHLLVRLRQLNILGVTCFCEDGDLLSQWRGYGINGYSIGFDPPALTECMYRAALPLAPVVYGSIGDTDASIAHSILEFLEVFSDDLRSPEKLQMDDDKLFAAISLLFMAAQVKHDAFQSEKEWRVADMATTGHSSVEFRRGGLGVIPYINMEIRPPDSELGLPIRRIVISPGPEELLRVQAVQTMLLHHGYQRDQVEVVPSKIPFRG